MIQFRSVTPEDIDLLFKWVNNPAVRENSFSSELIEYEDHKKWFLNKISNKETLIYILTDNNVDIGQIRLDIHNSEALIDYSIDEKYRGRGYGKLLLSLVEEKIKSEYPSVEKLVARVKGTNKASINIFEGLKYSISYTEYYKSLTQN